MPESQIRDRSDIGLWPPTWPMGLTMLRLLLLPVFLWLILLDAHEGRPRYRWWAVVVFAVMAATDKLDGYLARRLNQTSKLGTILDPVADKLLVACSVILLSFDWIATKGFQIPLIVVAVIYASYIAVAVGTLVVLAVAGSVRVTARPLGKLGTVLQLTLVLLTLVAPCFTPLIRESLRKMLVVLWWAVPIWAALTCADYAIQGIRQMLPGRRGTGHAADVQRSHGL